MPPCSLTVQSEGAPQARATDRATCVGPPDFIVMGSATVLVDGLPAARMTDKTMHGGFIMAGALTVQIGGPATGATLGNPAAGGAACAAAALGRTPPPGTLNSSGNPVAAGTTQQSYNNCGIESSRQVLNQATGANISQETLLAVAGILGLANMVPGNLFMSGGTTSPQMVALLQAVGAPAAEVAPTMDNLKQAVAEGRGAIVSVWSSVLWSPFLLANPGLASLSWFRSGGHGVLVTGLQYDAAGNLQNVIINDTGTGNCSQAIPAAGFASALMGGGSTHVVTDNPIW